MSDGSIPGAAVKALIEKWRAKADKDWHLGHDDVEDGVWAYQNEANGAAKARRDDADELEALVRSSLSEGQWLPIETAPKDGTQVWAWDDARGSNPALYVRDGDTWVITYDDAEIQPTHWQLLPQPPSARPASLDETQQP